MHTYQNIFYLTIGLTFITLFFGFLFTYFIEINIKKVIKSLLDNTKDKNKVTSIDSKIDTDSMKS